jgi:hypothetical protein
MHHFSSQSEYNSFLKNLAAEESEVIEEWGAYEVASSVVALVDDRATEIQLDDDDKIPDIGSINAPLCPITVLEYSQSTSGIPHDEVEHITHLAVSLLEQDLEEQ